MTTIDDLERAVTARLDEISGELGRLRVEVAKASNFQVGFQAISKTLTYVCIIAAAAATVYGALLR